MATKGGADTAIENNNVYALEPKSYVEGTDPLDQANTAGDSSGPTMAGNAATIVVSLMGVGLSVVVLLALFKYLTQ